MANVYIDPDGSGTAPYETVAKAATTLNVGLDAAAAGDTVIMTNRLDHTMAGGTFIIPESGIRVINQSDDGDWSRVAFTSWVDNSGIRIADDAHFSMRGITINDAAFTADPHAVLSATTSNGVVLRLTDMRFTGIDTTGATATGGIAKLTGDASGTSHLYATNVRWDNCLGGTTSNPCIANMNSFPATFKRCSGLNNGNRATDQAGHWLFWATVAAHTITFEDCYFDRCDRETGDGGALYFFSDDTILTANIYRTLFNDCLANKGGGVWFGRDVQGLLHDCKFIDCEATDFGGGGTGKGTTEADALGTSLEIVNTLFLRCTQTGVGNAGGGAVRIDGGKFADITNGTFIDCTAAGTKGGNSVMAVDHDAGGTAAKSTVRNSCFLGTGVHVVGEANDGFDTIDRCSAPNGTSSFTDTGATITNISTVSAAQAGLVGPDYLTELNSVNYRQGADVAGVHDTYAGRNGSAWGDIPSIGIDDGGLSLQMMRKRRA